MEICIKFWPFNPLTRSTLNVQWNRKLVVGGSSARNQIQFSFSPSQHQKTIHILFSPMTRNNYFKRTELCNSWKWSFLLSFDSYLVTNSYVRIKFKDQLQPKLMKKNHCSIWPTCERMEDNSNQWFTKERVAEACTGTLKTIYLQKILIELRVQKNINIILQNNVIFKGDLKKSILLSIWLSRI